MKTQQRMVTHHLRVELTEDQIRKFADEAAHCDKEISDVTAAFEAVKKQHKAELEELEARRKKLLSKVRDKSEYQDVECTVFSNYELGNVTTIRNDTRETVSERAMLNEERQTSLPLSANDCECDLDEPGDAPYEGPLVGGAKRKKAKKKAMRKARV